MLLTAQLSSPPYPFRLLCEQDIRGLIESNAKKADASPMPNVRPMLRQLKPHEVDEMVRLYETGSDCTPNQLAARFGVHRTTVMANLRRRGVTIRRTCPRLSHKDVTEAADLYRDGWSLSQLGDRFGVSLPTVSRVLRDVGVVIRPSGRRTPRG